MREIFESVLTEALKEARNVGVSIFTFAIYYDHESPAVSVCIDTVEQSAATVASINSYNAKHFHKKVAGGDLNGAAMWCANIGRSLSLGDFKMVNVGRRELGENFSPNAEFFVGLIKSVIAAESEITELSTNPEALILCCSGAENEVEYWWAPGVQGPNNSLQGRRP